MFHGTGINLKRITLKPQGVLPPSRLYNLQPIGIRTALVESFTSIIARLAKAHCVSVGALVGWIIAPHLNKQYMLNVISGSGSILGGRIRGLIKTLNGKGAAAAEWVQVYEDLTLSKDIQFLTLLPWSHVLSEKYLLRSYQVWCPTCFEEWRCSRREIYEPLLWMINIVNVCVYHCLRLRSQCPWCNSNYLPLLVARSQPGHCSKCKKWLGVRLEPIDAANKDLSQDELDWQLFVASSVGEFLAAGPNISPPTREKVRESITACAERYTNGNVTQFARFIQVSPSTVSNWYRGHNVLQLDMLLKICHRLRISVLEFLTGHIGDSNYSGVPGSCQPLLQKSLKPVSRPTILKMGSILKLHLQWKEIVSLEDIAKRYGHCRSKLRRHYPDLCQGISARYASSREDYWNEIRSTMQLAITEQPPSSVISFAARVGQSKSTLYKHLRDLCHVMAARYREYRKECSVKAKNQLLEEVQDIAMKLCENGIQPTQTKVSKLLTKPGRISNKEARRIVRKVKLHLS